MEAKAASGRRDGGRDLAHDPPGPRIPAAHAVLSEGALLRVIERDYAVDKPAACRYWHRGLNDTYDVRTPSARYVARVSRAGWRSDEALRYELDALAHLTARGVPVAMPVAGRDGEPLRALRAPEGRRQLILFAYAPGRACRDEEEGYPARYGDTVARIHAATDDFAGPHARARLDLGELLERPLIALRPVLEAQPAAWREVQELAERLRSSARGLPALDRGFCHGDCHGGNAHLEGDTLTFFDFDCCGPGWRAYDLAVYLWDKDFGDPGTAQGRWQAFLSGYRARRPLGKRDLAVAPLFVALRQLWWLGLCAANAPAWGHELLDGRQLERELTYLRKWASLS